MLIGRHNADYASKNSINIRPHCVSNFTNKTHKNSFNRPNVYLISKVLTKQQQRQQKQTKRQQRRRRQRHREMHERKSRKIYVLCFIAIILRLKWKFPHKKSHGCCMIYDVCVRCTCLVPKYIDHLLSNDFWHTRTSTFLNTIFHLFSFSSVLPCTKYHNPFAIVFIQNSQSLFSLILRWLIWIL